jgi:hypothetical protein
MLLYISQTVPELAMFCDWCCVGRLRKEQRLERDNIQDSSALSDIR